MLIFLGLFIANPVVDAPIIRLSGGGAPPIFPFLFVTIACGAIGVPGPLAKTLMAVLVISFAATTLDTATRIQRFILTEIVTTISIRLLQNRCIAIILALFPSLILTMWNVQNINTGEITRAGWALWPIFGASNQMLVALTLMVLSLYFFLRKKSVLPLVLPFLFITAITLTALILKIQAFWGTNRPLAIISIILFVFVLWILAEGCVAFKKGKRHQNF